MKKHILLILSFCVCSICNAKESINKDSIRICYSIGTHFIGGQDHCITIWFENDHIFLQRICYSIYTNIPIYMGEYVDKYVDKELSLQDKSEPVLMLREKALEYAILRHYEESTNYLILDELVEISKFQLEELIKITNEIKKYLPEARSNPDEIIINTGGSISYMIKNKNRTTVVFDWHRRYDRSRDIEKVLGLQSYLRCPCLEEDLKQMNNIPNKGTRWQRIWRL